MGISLSKGVITHSYCIQGNISLACKVGEEALHSAEKSGDTLSKNWATTQYGSALYYKGIFDTAEKYLLEGLVNSQKASEDAAEIWAAWTLGHLHFEMGAYGKAEEYYNKTMKGIERSKIFPSAVDAAKAYLTWAGVRAGTEGQDADLSVLFGYYENNKLKFFKGMIARSIGDILMQVDDENMADSEIWIKKAIEADKRNGTRWNLATDHALYADWFKKKGDLSNAKGQLTRAIEILKECGADGWVKKYEAEMASLS
jgi:tetratricopeptide (TPR) repeat protein